MPLKTLITIKSQNQHPCLNRLKFQCKRGNLETELLLIAYVENCIEPTSNQAFNKIFNKVSTQLQQQSEQLTLFEALLNESDQALFNWLLPHSLETEKQAVSAIPAQYRTLIADIRYNYLNSNR